MVIPLLLLQCDLTITVSQGLQSGKQQSLTLSFLPPQVKMFSPQWKLKVISSVLIMLINTKKKKEKGQWKVMIDSRSLLAIGWVRYKSKCLLSHRCTAIHSIASFIMCNSGIFFLMHKTLLVSCNIHQSRSEDPLSKFSVQISFC